MLITPELVHPLEPKECPPLPGYYLFIGFCIASLLLSKKRERGIRSSQGTEPN